VGHTLGRLWGNVRRFYPRPYINVYQCSIKITCHTDSVQTSKLSLPALGIRGRTVSGHAASPNSHQRPRPVDVIKFEATPLRIDQPAASLLIIKLWYHAAGAGPCGKTSLLVLLEEVKTDRARHRPRPQPQPLPLPLPLIDISGSIAGVGLKIVGDSTQIPTISQR
jgi:hypothetical protein